MEYQIYLYDFITLALAHFVALLSPGADFFIIIGNTSKYGKKAGFATVFGISIANLVYILLALFGITLIKDNELIFTSIKFIGSFYLIYIGILLLKAPKRELFHKYEIKKSKKRDFVKYFLQGFLSAILNPKNSIFYFTMFSISIQAHTAFAIQSFYAIWMFFAVLAWDIFIVYLVNQKNTKLYMEKYSNLIEKISGLILFLIAALIIINSL